MRTFVHQNRRENLRRDHDGTPHQMRRRGQQFSDLGLFQQGTRRLPRQFGSWSVVQPRCRHQQFQPQKQLRRSETLVVCQAPFCEDGIAILRPHYGRPFQEQHQHNVQYRHGNRSKLQHIRHGLPEEFCAVVLVGRRGFGLRTIPAQKRPHHRTDNDGKARHRPRRR